MKMDGHIISCASSNMKGRAVCGGYLFVFWTTLNRITIILFFDFISCYLVRMKCERLVLKINLHQFVKVWQYPKLSDLFNFSLTLTIMLCNRGVRKHTPVQGAISHEEILTTGGESSSRWQKCFNVFQVRLSLFMSLDCTNPSFNI